MKKTKRFMAFLMSAMMTAAVPVGNIANAEIIEVSHMEDGGETVISTNRLTLEEAAGLISGEGFKWLSGKQPVLLPTKDCNRWIPTITPDNKLHNIHVRKIITSIRMKTGKELPYDDIKAEVEGAGLIMPVIQKNGNDYELINAVSEQAYNAALDLIKACPDVTAIEMKYQIYEDINGIQFYGMEFDEGADVDEILAKYPELERQPSDNGLDFSYTGGYDKLYDFISRLNDNGESVKPFCMMTSLGMLKYTYYYCTEPVLLDGTAGDANIDGYVDLSDSVMIMQSIANPDKYGSSAESGITAQGTANGDTDKDGLTGMDSLNIQKSLLGMGNIPIPPKDKDIPLVSYDPVDFTEEKYFSTFTMNGIEYWMTAANVSKNKIGEKISDNVTVSVKDEEKTGTVYSMNGFADEAAVALQYSGSNNYQVFRNPKYLPATIGELIDGMELDKQITFSGIYADRFDPSRTLKFEPEQEIIWDTLFGDRDIEILERSENNDSLYMPRINGKRANDDFILHIGWDMPIMGRYNMGFTVYPTGYVRTNLVDYGLQFNISEEKAKALIEYFENKE
ncbi:MAG: hypothetical protein K6B38_13130 [Ruminococcus sp.]|nr:hypothetical protein [Ruminococcus sp.]